VGWAVARRWPWNLHGRIRDIFIRKFQVDVSDAQYPLQHYPTLGEFFVRRLRPGARPMGSSTLVSPVDGMLTQRGGFAEDAEATLTQIKGIRYTLKSFAGEGWDVSPYAGGAFLTLYLAPWSYHRIHSPVDGKVSRVRHVAGTLWPVNSWSVQNIPDLFVRNDRILVEMETGQGRLMVVLVGATNVGRITLSFCPDLIGNSASAAGIRDWKPTGDVRLEKGGELGCFEMGSTVVLIVDAAWASRLKKELSVSTSTNEVLGVNAVLEPIPMRVGVDLVDLSS